VAVRTAQMAQAFGLSATGIDSTTFCFCFVYVPCQIQHVVPVASQVNNCCSRADNGERICHSKALLTACSLVKCCARGGDAWTLKEVEMQQRQLRSVPCAISCYSVILLRHEWNCKSNQMCRVRENKARLSEVLRLGANLTLPVRPRVKHLDQVRSSFIFAAITPFC
jgi:hypothetical protein